MAVISWLSLLSLLILTSFIALFFFFLARLPRFPLLCDLYLHNLYIITGLGFHHTVLFPEQDWKLELLPGVSCRKYTRSSRIWSLCSCCLWVGIDGGTITLSNPKYVMCDWQLLFMGGDWWWGLSLAAIPNKWCVNDTCLWMGLSVSAIPNNMWLAAVVCGWGLMAGLSQQPQATCDVWLTTYHESQPWLQVFMNIFTFS